MSYGGDINNAGDDSWNLVQLNSLERYFERMLPETHTGYQWCRIYADWLERQGIKVSDDRGWPSTDVYRDSLVQEFIRLNARPPDDEDASEVLRVAQDLARWKKNRERKDLDVKSLLRAIEMLKAYDQILVTMRELERTRREITIRIRPEPDPTICNVYVDYGDDPLGGGVQSSLMGAIMRAYGDLKKWG